MNYSKYNYSNNYIYKSNNKLTIKQFKQMKILGRNFPIFNKAVKWVCRANQVMTEDGKSIEDKLAAGGSSGSGGNGMLKLSFCGLSEEGNAYEVLSDESVTNNDSNCVPKSQVDAILAAPMGSIIAICNAWIDNNGNFVDSTIIGLGVKVERTDFGDCDITVKPMPGENVPTELINIDSQAETNGILMWYTPK